MNCRICSVCNVELRPYKTGVTLAEMTTFGPQALYSSDEYECPTCNWTGILGRANEPFSRGTIEQLEAEIEAYESKGIRVVRYWLNEREKHLYETNKNKYKSVR